MRVARRFVIAGRVQGVGFRFFAEQAARHAGVGGWVANRADGSVEVLAEGERDAVDRFEAAVRTGPRSARVDRVTVTDEPASNRDESFTIRA